MTDRRHVFGEDEVIPTEEAREWVEREYPDSSDDVKWRFACLRSLLVECRAAELVGDEQGYQRARRLYGLLLIEQARELGKKIQGFQSQAGQDHELQEAAILMAHIVEQTEAKLDTPEGT